MVFSFCFWRFLWRLLTASVAEKFSLIATSKHKRTQNKHGNKLYFFKCTFKNTMQNKARNYHEHIKNKKRRGVFAASVYFGINPEFLITPLCRFSHLSEVFSCLSTSFGGLCSRIIFFLAVGQSYCLDSLAADDFRTNNPLNKRMFSLWSWWQESGSQRKWFRKFALITRPWNTKRRLLITPQLDAAISNVFTLFIDLQ